MACDQIMAKVCRSDTSRFLRIESSMVALNISISSMVNKMVTHLPTGLSINSNGPDLIGLTWNIIKMFIRYNFISIPNFQEQVEAVGEDQHTTGLVYLRY